MASSLSNLVNNLSERTPIIKYTLGHENKNAKHVELNISMASFFSNMETSKMI